MLDSRMIECPYCGESMEIEVDLSGGMTQNYVEDCQVCCRPWQVKLHVDTDGYASLELKREDD